MIENYEYNCLFLDNIANVNNPKGEKLIINSRKKSIKLKKLIIDNLWLISKSNCFNQIVFKKWDKKSYFQTLKYFFIFFTICQI